MGDIGSLSTGAALGTLAILLKKRTTSFNYWRRFRLGSPNSDYSSIIF
jgi:hypothetical protein